MAESRGMSENDRVEEVGKGQRRQVGFDSRRPEVQGVKKGICKS